MAVPFWSADAVVAHASPPPAIGSTVRLTSGLPAAEETSSGSAALNRTSPGCSAFQSGASNGPPEGAAFGQVWVSVSTPFRIGTLSSPLT